MFLFFLIIALPSLLITIEFIHFLVTGRAVLNVKLYFLLELAALIIPC
jgi:hypothetical protein